MFIGDEHFAVNESTLGFNSIVFYPIFERISFLNKLV